MFIKLNCASDQPIKLKPITLLCGLQDRKAFKMLDIKSQEPPWENTHYFDHPENGAIPQELLSFWEDFLPVRFLTGEKLKEETYTFVVETHSDVILIPYEF